MDYTLLRALQAERHYLLLRKVEVESQEGGGFHPTIESRGIMQRFEQITAKINEMVDAALMGPEEQTQEGEPGYVLEGEKVKEVVNGYLYPSGDFCVDKKGTNTWEPYTLPLSGGRKKVTVIFHKEEE